MNETLETRAKNLTSELEKSSRRVSELTIEKETLDIQVKNLLCDLEYSKSQLLAFSSGSEKLDNILGMGKPAKNKGGLGFKENDASTSNTMLIPATDSPKHVPNPDFKDKRFVRQSRTRRPRNRNHRPHNIGPRFIPTYFQCGELGHIKPKCYHFLNKNRNRDLNRNKYQDYVGQINFLTNQVSKLATLMIQTTGNIPVTRQVRVKKSDLKKL
ncbi:unnamed protein product [Fraxinus pennsylvanica]|uniref:CCHC-type domain-containing protein n=1 Tax=Fraxinus pennsylvanica TaxID=56036 RepID=A0AAD2ED47_9LAMI|nr:unnamed protein product [Fraxinus pennsylvanica]